MKMKNNLGIYGSYVIKVFDYITGVLISQSEPIKNRVVNSSGYGRNIVIRQLAGDATYPIEIDSAAIGTGSTAPVDGNIGLGASVLAGILVANVVVSSDSVVFTFFINTNDLTNGTYNEFGLFCNGQLFARSIISPALVKGTNQNVVVDYTITLSSI